MNSSNLLALFVDDADGIFVNSTGGLFLIEDLYEYNMASNDDGGFLNRDNMSNVSVEPADMTMDITPEQQHRLELLFFWIYAVLTNIVVVLGLIGNSLTIMILSQRAMRSSTNFYLCALAVWDSILLVCTMLLVGLKQIPDIELYSRYVHSYVVSYVYPIGLTAQTATIWLTVSFTVERYIAVCHPLKAASMCTLSRAKIVITGVAVGSMLYNIPRWFDYRPVTLHEYNQTFIGFIRTPFSQNHLYMEVYYSWLYVPIMCIVPLLVLSVLNTCLILAVRRSQRQRLDMNVRQSRENNVTIMLVSVVIVFIICQVPALVYNLAWAINDTYTENSYGYMVLSIIRNFLVNLNSAVNFILYCALGQKFRRIFLHTFCRRCVHENYIPMSGVHHQTQVGSLHSQRHFRTGPQKQLEVVNHTNHTNHTNHNHTHSTPGSHVPSRSSQESSLMSSCDYHSPPAAFKKANYGDREVCTYTAAPPADKLKKRPRSTLDTVESDNEQNYDITMEKLLPDRNHSNQGSYPMYTIHVSNGNTRVPV